MQKLLLPVLFFAMLITLACNRKVNAGNKNDAALIGTWELREDQSGMMPVRQHPEGNGNRYRFTATTFEQYVNGALEKSGTYRVESDSTVEKEIGLKLPPGEFTRRIVFEDDASSSKTFFQLTGNKLVLLSGFFPTDGGSRITYQRISENE